jgi:hypothetical protein
MPQILCIAVLGSELSIEDLRGYLACAFTNICVVLSVGSSDTLRDAVEKSAAVRESETGCASTELTVLLIVVELGELSNDSVEMREVAVSIIFKSVSHFIKVDV